MFFGLFGSRGVDASVTTDMILEDQQQQELERMAQLHLRQRQAARAYDVQEEVYDLERDKARLRDERDTLRTQVRSLESELAASKLREAVLKGQRANLVTTALNLAVARRALEWAVANYGNPPEITRVHEGKAQQLLSDTDYVNTTISQLEACAKQPWQLPSAP